MTKTSIISLWTCFNLFLLVLVDKLAVAETVHSSANTIGIQTVNTTISSLQYNNNENTNNKEEWYYDLWNLPSDVPLPGTSWLSRMALSMSLSSSSEYSSSLLITYQGQQYNNIYEAIVFGIPSTSSSATTVASKKTLQQNQTTTINDEKEQEQNIHDNHNNNHPCRNLNAYINSIFIPPVIAHYIVHYIAFDNIETGHYIICYIRNFIAAMIIYYGVGLLFHYFCYVYYGNSVFNDKTGRQRPTTATILHQIKLAQSSLPIYVMLPVVDEYLIENNYTYVYYTIDEIGGYINYMICQILYFTLVEICIYWIHRTLHTNKWLYMNIHLKHHQYNKIDTLTPWASLAFYPFDGILQASPYVFILLIMPCHYVTHMLLLFFTAFWATYIHDTMEWNIFPIMGSAYHTVHHTHYKYNFGQVFIFCDYFWNTLYLPPSNSNRSKSNNNSESSNNKSKKDIVEMSSTNSMKTKQQ